MFGVLIILFDSLANFRGCNPHNGIGIGVIVGGAAKNLHPQDPLFEVIRLAGQRVRDHKFQEAGIPFAGIKKRCGEQLFELLLNGGLFEFAGRCPALRYLLY
jgi:hypothetical protein